DITDPTTAMNMALALMAKAFKLKYSTPTNNKQRISSNLRNRQIAQPGNLNGYNDVQNVGNHVIQHAVHNPRIQNVGKENGLIGVPGNVNHNANGNGNFIAARTEGNATRHNGNQISKHRHRVLRLTKLLSMTQRSAEVHNYNNCYDNETFNMFTQEEQYTELLEPIPAPHQVPKNDNNVISEVVQNAVQNSRVQNVRNQNGLIVVPGIANQNPDGNGNLVAARAEGNATGHNGNQIRCYNCRGLGHFARNCTVRPRRRDAAYLQTQLLIAQKEETGNQLQAK
nr:Gag-Pol polyprotein [Tanacetum cinerariifolium]